MTYYMYMTQVYMYTYKYTEEFATLHHNSQGAIITHSQRQVQMHTKTVLDTITTYSNFACPQAKLCMCIVLSNKVCSLCWCHNVDELNSKQHIPMCSSVWSRLSPVFFVEMCLLFTLSNMILIPFFSQKCFSKNGMTMRNPKTNQRKESWGMTSGTTKWDRLGQVVIHGTSGTGTGGSPYWVGQDGTGAGGSSD